MYQISREKVNLSLEKKLWIIREIKSIKKFLNRDLLWIFRNRNKILYCANS